MNESFQSPKIIILNYYDSLIREVDIYSEKLLEKYSENDLLPPQPDPIPEFRPDELKEPKNFGVEQINDPYYLPRYNYDNITDQINVTPGQTRICDYINLMRQKAIEKIRKIEEENLDLYKSIKKIIDKHKPIEEQLFADKFCFLVKIDRLISRGIFNLFIVSSDFYLNKSEVESFNVKMETSLKVEFSKKQTFQELLFGLLEEYIYGIWRSQKYAVKIIDIEKDKLFNIQRFSYLANHRFDFNLIDPDYYFSNIKSLTIRNRGFYGNRIVDLSSLSKLEYLTIEKFQLKLSKLYDLKNLIEIEIESCSLVDLDETSLNNLSSLQVLKISDSIGYSKKPSLRIDLNHLVNLKWLEIYNFWISTLISKQGSNSLVYVKFFKCGLKTDILSSLFDLSELKHLEITEPKCSSQIVNWGIIVQLDKLEKLNLKNANVKVIDFHFSESLEYLDLSGNRLEEINEGVFLHLKRLKHLDLSRNQLNRLDENVFDGLENLEVLLMNNSGRIRSIGKDVFKGLSNLLELDLGENHIVEIHCEAFIHVPQLTKLVLLKNFLNLNRNSVCFSTLKNLKELILRLNDDIEQKLWELERWAEFY